MKKKEEIRSILANWIAELLLAQQYDGKVSLPREVADEIYSLFENSEWISVKNRVPENNDRVIIVAMNDIEDDYCYPYIYNEAVEVGFYEEGKWFSDTRFNVLDLYKEKHTIEEMLSTDEGSPFRLWGNIDVTHWMPLPEPPEEEEDVE